MVRPITSAPEYVGSQGEATVCLPVNDPTPLLRARALWFADAEPVCWPSAKENDAVHVVQLLKSSQDRLRTYASLEDVDRATLTERGIGP